MNVAAYVRYSSDNQREESLSAQLHAIEDYARKNNCSVVKIYSDKAKTATSDKRPEFQKMIQDSALGIFDAVIVHKLDRFSRDRYDSASYKRKLKKNGIRLLSVTENLDDSPESVILESLLEGMAEYYSKNLAREVMKGMRETAYQCKHNGGKPPLGYDVLPDKTYAVNPAEAEIVRTIFRLYLDGHGYKGIINHLNDKSYRTKLGRPFGKNSIHDLLTNEKYAGVYVFNKTSSKDAFGQRNCHSSKGSDEMIRVEGGMPAIVSKEDFAAAQRKMARNKHQAGFYKAKELYLLSGLIFCGECGHSMQGNSRISGRNKERYISYRCGQRDRNKTCNNKEIRREYIEAFVLSELQNKLFNDNVIPVLTAKLNEHLTVSDKGRNEEIQHLKARLSETERQIANIVSAVSQGFVQDSFRDRLTGLENEKTKLEVRIKELCLQVSATSQLTTDQIRKLFSMFKHFVMEKNLPECKKFIDHYVEKVVIFHDHVEVTLKVAEGPFGGGGGSRTPVRKKDQPSLSERSS